MKKIILILIVSVFLFQTKAVFALKLNNLESPNEPIRNVNNGRLASISAPMERLKNLGNATPSANKMENLRERARNEIERRITSLNKLISKINGLKKITDAQKAEFVNQIQAEITSLTSLKTKIEAGTELATLKTDVQSIVKSYRVYLLFIPKINVLVAADSLDALADKLDALAAKLELRINSAGDASAETLKTTLSDMKAKTANIRVQSQKARDAVLSLTPDGYPGNKTSLEQGRQYIVAGRKDVHDAKQDAEIIIQGLRGIFHPKTATDSAE
jgi:hypothetical protein